MPATVADDRVNIFALDGVPGIRSPFGFESLSWEADPRDDAPRTARDFLLFRSDTDFESAPNRKR